MLKFAITIFLIGCLSCASAQTTHSVLVKVNQGTECPVVSGLEEVEHIKVFPNPVETSRFTIQSDIPEARVEINDLNGSVVWQAPLAEGQTEVEASSFRSGMYIINVIGVQTRYKMKIQVR